MAAFDFAFWQLLFKIVGRQTGEISRVDFLPQKPRYEDVPVAQAFPRATPESQGISSEYIRSYLMELREDGEANPHHVMILRHGKVITECSFAPYVRGMWHITHSMCKSFTGMAVGLLIEEGKLALGERLQDIFPEYTGPLDRIFAKTITIENLLDMTSEVDFSEAGAISGNDWCAGFMAARCKCEPGTKFDYNSMNSYMLSAVIQKRTGMTMFTYLKKKLFDPMGITEVFWENSPKGITKGGWGMFIRPEDACKLGQLYLQRGRWGGRQLIPEAWVTTSTRLHADNGKFGYGFQLWLEERKGGFAYNGLFGQDVVIYPDLDMVLLVNAGNREMTQSGSLTEIMRGYFGKHFAPAEVLPEDPDAQKALADTIAEYETIRKPERKKDVLGIYPPPRRKLESEMLTAAISGHTWRLEGGRIGIFPLICQVMHNNFTDGIREVRFVSEDGVLVMIFREGEEFYQIRIGFDRAEKSEIILHGEPYLVGTFGRITQDEQDRVVLCLDISFIEEACARQFYFAFDEEDLELTADETPGNAVIRDALIYTGDQPGLEKLPFVKSIAEGGGTEILESTVQSAIHPVDIGHLIRERG